MMYKRRRKPNRLLPASLAVLALAMMAFGISIFALAGGEGQMPIEEPSTKATEPFDQSVGENLPDDMSKQQDDKPDQEETPADPDPVGNPAAAPDESGTPMPNTDNLPAENPPLPPADEDNTPTSQSAEPLSAGSALGAMDPGAATVVQPADIPWYKQLFNQHNRVGSDFSPPSLRTLAGSHVSVDARIYEPLTQMMESARAAGATIWAQSGYRTYSTQRELFENRVNSYIGRGYSRTQAEQNTALWIAVPGTSEHQSGLAVDFNCITMAFEQTLAFSWLVENAHRYGFILRYPPGTTHITGISYEPWHFRYVRVYHASRIWESGVTLEEYVKWYFGR